MSDKLWYGAGLRFQCTECGNCCGGAPGYVWVTRDEMTKIGDFLGMTVKEFIRRYARRVGFRFSLVEMNNLDCVFLRRADGKGVCAIYPVRPLQCRTWPFWTCNLKSPRVWESAAEKCPGMNCGAVRDAATIERIRTAETRCDLP